MALSHALMCGCLAAVVVVGPVHAQSVVTADVSEVQLSPTRDDVKAIGMGNTQVANGKTFNAMQYNPALLARTRTAIDVVSVQANLPLNSFDAFAFLRDNADQFRSASFITTIDAGVRALGAAQTPDQEAAAIRQINGGLSFLSGLGDKVIGSADNPKVHGFVVIPAVQVQVGNLGFSLHSTLRSAFVTYPGDVLGALYALRLPTDLTSLSQSELIDLSTKLYNIINPLLDPTTHELRYPQQVIPKTVALSYLDVVGTVGYGFQVFPDLSVGANLKLVNRRVSTRVINSDNYKDILSELRKDFESSATGVTLDLGGLYRLASTGTEFGISLQNMIPLPRISPTATFNSVAYDENHTLQVVEVHAPFEFTSPFLVNIGVTHPILSNWDASFDWVDMAQQDDQYPSTMARLRLGTEFRLDAIPQMLGLALRGGVENRKLAGGVGVNLFRVVQIDGAYAWDNIVEDYAVYAQVRVGW